MSLSRFLSYVLRHAPEAIGIELAPGGWVHVDELIARCAAAGRVFDRSELEAVIAGDSKRRFTLSPDGSRVRAAQGHSVPVDLGLVPVEPPAVLFHGTATQFLEAILQEGLKPQRRKQVHLSPDAMTAAAVGSRHGKPVVLTIESCAMHQAGFMFFEADNGVWLTDHVPARYLGMATGARAD
jgi:putative RNA 2'-phosphotransferase